VPVTLFLRHSFGSNAGIHAGNRGQQLRMGGGRRVRQRKFMLQPSVQLFYQAILRLACRRLPHSGLLAAVRRDQSGRLRWRRR